MMNLLSKTIWFCAVVSIIIISAGLVLYEYGYGGDILWLGVLLLILTPFFGILVSMASFIHWKERKWAVVSAVLISITIMGMAISFFL